MLVQFPYIFIAETISFRIKPAYNSVGLKFANDFRKFDERARFPYVLNAGWFFVHFKRVRFPLVQNARAISFVLKRAYNSVRLNCSYDFRKFEVHERFPFD